MKLEEMSGIRQGRDNLAPIAFSWEWSVHDSSVQIHLPNKTLCLKVQIFAPPCLP